MTRRKTRLLTSVSLIGLAAMVSVTEVDRAFGQFELSLGGFTDDFFSGSTSGGGEFGDVGRGTNAPDGLFDFTVTADNGLVLNVNLNLPVDLDVARNEVDHLVGQIEVDNRPLANAINNAPTTGKKLQIVNQQLDILNGAIQALGGTPDATATARRTLLENTKTKLEGLQTAETDAARRSAESASSSGIPNSVWDATIGGSFAEGASTGTDFDGVDVVRDDEFLIRPSITLDNGIRLGPDVGAEAADAGVGAAQDSEFYFRPSITLDNGIRISGNIQFEADDAGNTVDDSYVFIKGSFGEILLGTENSAGYRMHYGAPDISFIDVGSPSMASYIPFSSATRAVNYSGEDAYPEGRNASDAVRYTYFSPKFAGFQLGVSYAQDAADTSVSQMDCKTPTCHFFEVGANYANSFGGYTIGGGYFIPPNESPSPPVVSSAGTRVLGIGLDLPEDEAPAEYTIGGDKYTYMFSRAQLRFDYTDTSWSRTVSPPANFYTDTPDPGTYFLNFEAMLTEQVATTIEQQFNHSRVQPRASQATEPGFIGPAETLGHPAFPADLFFNSRGSWGQDYADQWGMHAIGFEPVAPEEADRTIWPQVAVPIFVAVLDTGLDRSHPDLYGQIGANRAEIFGNGIDDDANGFVDDAFGWNFVSNNFDTTDDNGHGTFVAGIIAARTNNGLGIAGVNPHARIIPVKITDALHQTNSHAISAGILYAMMMGARVINLSVGGDGLSELERTMIQAAVKQGIVVVVAAGNEGKDIADYGPAGAPGAITVTATDRDDARPAYANRGRAIDVAAPGEDILSLRAYGTDMLADYQDGYETGTAIIGGGRDYYLASGTSFSAPFVSGLASLILSHRPWLTGEQVARIIINSARDIDAPGIDLRTGYGIVDARAALNADPEFHMNSRISGVQVARRDGKPVVAVIGTADADRLGAVSIEIGAGEEPSEWREVGDTVDEPTQDALVGVIPAQEFRGSKIWILRLTVKHENGRTREARYRLKLG